MSELLAYIQRLQEIEDELATVPMPPGSPLVFAHVKCLRLEMQAEVDRCEAAYARELRDTERELATITNPVYAEGPWPGVR